MNRIDSTLAKNSGLLSVYFSAGYPALQDTSAIIESLQKNGVGMIEIGLPFSDPLADGPTIQASSQQALSNGMTSELLFSQLINIRETITIPLLIMGYLNPILQFGIENFCKRCNEVGVDGLIIPDLPVSIYESEYRDIVKKYRLHNIFLITPQTSTERIRYIDSISSGFIYVVASDNTTGTLKDFDDNQTNYFKRISDMNLKNPIIIGFGIGNQQTFDQATKYASGAIVGSAFVQFIAENPICDIGKFTAKFLH